MSPKEIPIPLDENVRYLANHPEKQVHNQDADFFTCRNCILQLAAENQITPDAVAVYCFYRSFAGVDRQPGGPETLAFDFSFQLISDNIGVSRKSIRRSLKLLRDAGVISYRREGLHYSYRVGVAFRDSAAPGEQQVLLIRASASCRIKPDGGGPGMKVIGVNGSPRKNGNTDYIMKVVFDCLKADGIETEIAQIGGKIVQGCKACDSCKQRKDGKCIIADDGLNELLAKLKDADGILLGSPTYTSDVTPEMKAFMDRAGRVSSANGGFFIRKAGSAVTAVRRGGAAHCLDSMNHWLHIQQIYIVGSSYWNMVYCREIGEAAKDEEGIKTMKTLGQNMAYLLERLRK